MNLRFEKATDQKLSKFVPSSISCICPRAHAHHCCVNNLWLLLPAHQAQTANSGADKFWSASLAMRAFLFVVQPPACD